MHNTSFVSLLNLQSLIIPNIKAGFVCDVSAEIYEFKHENPKPPKSFDSIGNYQVAKNCLLSDFYLVAKMRQGRPTATRLGHLFLSMIGTNVCLTHYPTIIARSMYCSGLISLKF